MNIRGGPGTNYAIVGAAAAGARLEITGKNAGGDWWRIDYQGQQRVDLRALCDGNQRGRGRGGAHACAAAHASPATDGNTVRCAQQR